MDSSLASKKVTPQSPEFVPANRSASVSSTSASPNFFNSFPGLVGSASVPAYNRGLVDSPHSGTASPRITPQPSPPPHALNNCSPTSFNSLEKPTVATTYQVKFVNRSSLHVHRAVVCFCMLCSSRFVEKFIFILYNTY